MSTFFGGSPGPRLPPVSVRTQPAGCEREPTRPMALAAGEDLYDVVSCHSTRDGFASITLREQRTGAVMTLQKIPFRHDYGEDSEAQCRRVQAEARKIIDNMADALAASMQPAQA